MLIVVQHYVVWGIKTTNLANFHVNGIYSLCDYISMEALYLLSCIGVNCFIMITGYFMIDRYEYRWKSVISLWTTTVFYSIVLFIISVGLGTEFSVSNFIGCFLPVWSDQYWFITKYIGLMLLAPFLSILATTLSKTSYRVLLIVLFCMSFMLPYGQIYAGGKSIMWMSFVYLMAGYLRLFGVNTTIKKHIKLITLSILLFLTVCIAGVDIIRYTDFHNLIGNYELHSFASDSPIFFLSLAIFVWAITRQPIASTSYVSCFAKIAPYVLAVYLIHMNNYFYVYIWKFVIPESYNIPIVIHALLWCSLITIICISIDYIRSVFFKLVGIDYFIKNISSRIKINSINKIN